MPILYVVAKPIGNLGDMTPRAVETLKAVGLIAAEDTRVTQKLLNAFDIHTPLTSCHEHNERGKAAFIVQRMLTEGLDVAVVTDAGTPCVSDPGTALVAQAVAAGVDACGENRVQELVEKRAAAKKAKDWAAADAIRAQLTEMGWAVKDTAQGPQLSKI